MKSRWWTIAIILGLVIVNYIDRSAISFAASDLRSEFGITPGEYGVISSAFSIGYMLFALLSGPLVDRYGSRRVLIVGMFIWAAATALTPFAGGFIGLILLRILLGAGEAPCFPAATRLVSRWLPAQERAKALALIGGVAVSGSLLVGGADPHPADRPHRLEGDVLDSGDSRGRVGRDRLSDTEELADRGEVRVEGRAGLHPCRPVGR